MPILTDQERCGTLLAGRYRLDAVLGRGGMGVVFRARDEDAGGTPVAVKLLRAEFALEQIFAKRFVREAKAAAAIRHPNVVEVRDLGVESDGTIYQVLQLLDGVSLADHLEVVGALSVERTLEIVLPVMAALESAHALGVVHRDLKPDNVFLARRGGEIVPTLLDFGIAKLLDGSASAATHTGSILGTPAYMAPEQAQGTKEQGPAIDVWAMGIVTYECLTGTTPFTGTAPTQVLVRILTETAQRADVEQPSVPAVIADVIARALARAPGERYASIGALAAALRQAAEQAGVPLPEPGRSATRSAFTLIARPRSEDDEAGSLQTELGSAIATTARAELSRVAGNAAVATRVGSAVNPLREQEPLTTTTPIDAGAASGPPSAARRPWMAAVVVAVLLGLAALGALAGRAEEETGTPAETPSPETLARERPEAPAAGIPSAPEASPSTVPAASGAAEARAAGPSPAASGPAASGPAASGPAASGPAGSTPGGPTPGGHSSRGGGVRPDPVRETADEPPLREAAPAPEEPPARPSARALPGVVDEW